MKKIIFTNHFNGGLNGFRISAFICAVFLPLLFSPATYAQTLRRVAYYASWTNVEPNQLQLDKLTHVIYSFALPNDDGSVKPVDNSQRLTNLVNLARSKGTKVLIAVGGWSDQGVVLNTRFQNLASTDAGRKRLAGQMKGIVDQYGLDGVDVDWEHPEPNTIHPDNYVLLIRELRNALGTGKLLSAAVVGARPNETYYGGGIKAEVFAYFDFLNLMAYDGDWQKPGSEHSPLNYAQSTLDYWVTQRGLPKDKANIGVPFYAKQGSGVFGPAYKDLLAQGADPYADNFGANWYNGITTIKAKTQLAKERAGGIMIWEISQDVNDSRSLLSAIYEASGGGGTTGLVTVYKNCNYDGASGGLAVGDYTLAQLNARGIANDDVSSLRVSAGYKAILYWDDNFAGPSVEITADNSCLVGVGAANGANWNDKVSSIRVQANTPALSRLIEAESYSAMLGVSTEGTTDAGGGQNVGWIDTGDWLAYNSINFPSSGTYTVEYRVASPSGGRLSLDLNAGATVLGNVDVPATGGWQTWRTVSHTVSVNAGTYNVGIYAQAGGWNFNWFKITKVSGARVGQPETALSGNQALLVYPNPAETHLMLRTFSGVKPSRFTIVNATGVEVAAGMVSAKGINVSALSPGMYTLLVSDGKRQVTTRFVKK